MIAAAILLATAAVAPAPPPGATTAATAPLESAKLRRPAPIDITALVNLLAAAAVAPMGAPTPASPAKHAPAKAAKPQRRVQITVTTLVNGSPAGDVSVDTDPSGDAKVDVKQLVALLKPVVSTEQVNALLVRAGGRAMAPVAVLSDQQLKLAFDVSALQLKVDLPVDSRALRTVSIAGSQLGNGGELTAPQNFSAGVTFLLADHFDHGNYSTLGRDALTVAARGFVNVGGIDGWNLAFLTGYREGERPFRQRTTIFHDDVDRAIRYSVGDVTPQSFGAYSSSDNLFGIGIERLYQTIQPYRNLRPAGRGALQLDRPSSVDVYVNGALYRTLQLQPGRYDLRDFPFLDGLNDVRLEVRDDTGTHESMALSFFSDTELLDPGISTFSAVAGFRQERSDDHGVGYAGSPAFTGFYERGLSDRLTLGGGIQADRRNGLVSGLGVFATPIGVFGAQGALDLHSGSAAEYAGLLSYRLFSSGATGRQSSLDVDLEYRSRNFSPMEEAGTDPVRYAYDIAARYQGELVKDWFLSASAGYSISRGDDPDLKSGSIGLSHRWGRINATINYTYLDPAPRADHRIGLTVSLPVGPRQQVRAGFDSDRNRIFGDYDLQGFEGLDQLNGHVSLSHNDEGETGVLDGEYYANRFRATVHHSYDTTSGFNSAVTDLGVAVGLGYAGGEFAIGRDADRGFTIITKHPTLGNATVVASDTYAVGPSARTGLLGPALVPTQRGYQPDSIKVDVNPLPPGYDIGAGQIDILPGAASGYVMHVGSDASNIVMGRLVDAKGKPVAYASGQLVAVGHTKGTPPTFITNRNGRLVAQKVAPGHYRVVSAGGESIGEITVPKDARGMVDVGVLTEKE